MDLVCCEKSGVQKLLNKRSASPPMRRRSGPDWGGGPLRRTHDDCPNSAYSALAAVAGITSGRLLRPMTMRTRCLRPTASVRTILRAPKISAARSRASARLRRGDLRHDSPAAPVRVNRQVETAPDAADACAK